MGENELKKSVGIVARAVERALEIRGGPPHWQHYNDDRHTIGVLKFDGDKVILLTPYASGYDDCAYVENESTEIPLRLLLMGEEAYETWKAGEVATYELNREASALLAIQKRDEEERKKYLELKAKFEPTD